MINRLEATLQKYNEIAEQLNNPDIISNIRKMTELSKEQKRLEVVVDVYKKYKKVLVDIENDKEMLHDKDLGEMAKEELVVLEDEKDQMENNKSTIKRKGVIKIETWKLDQK